MQAKEKTTMTKRNNVFQNMWSVAKFIATGERPVPTVETPSEKAEREMWETLRKSRDKMARALGPSIRASQNRRQKYISSP
jgi:hypothetical protein